MGKNSGKSKNSIGDKSIDSNSRLSKPVENGPRAYDKDTEIFIAMAQELKDEGNRLFQKRDCEGAMLKYEKAIKLLPRNHIDVSYLRSNMAQCYMQLGISEYPRAIHECNLALEVTPKYSKALLKRARCYEALNRLDLALRDVGTVLKMEPNNLMAIEIAERVQKSIEKLGSRVNEIPMDVVPLPEYMEPPPLPQTEVPKEKVRNKKSKDVEEKVNGKVEENKDDGAGEEKEREEKAKEKKENYKVLVRKSEEQIEEKKAEEITVVESKDKRAGNVKENKEKAKEKNANHEVAIRKPKAQTEKEKDEDKMVVENKDNGAENVKENIKERKADNEVDIRNLQGQIEEKKTEDKLVVEEEKIIEGVDEEPKRTVKLVFGEDIRWAQIPLNCNVLKLREIISDRFPNSKAFLVKYRDQEGDLITITTTEELRWAESSAIHGSVKLYIVEVDPHQDPFFQGTLDTKHITENGHIGKQKEVRSESTCISDWIIQFSQLFKNYVGVDIDAYIDLHEVGTKLYSEAIEEVVTSEEAQDLFNTAAEKFQEMAALALFNWGNVHMSRARKRVYFSEDSSRESVLAEVKRAYDWALNEYTRAGKRYEEALKIKPDFYEAVLALGQQQFEQAKLSWYYAVSTDVDLESWPSTDVLQLYNSAEENMEKGMQMWVDSEAYRVNEVSKSNKVETLLQEMKLDDLFKSMSTDEAKEQAANIRCQIYILWGTLLYERSIMEFKLGFPVWQECLEVAVEKFELAGASPTDIAVMIKNHYSNKTASEGLGFNIDEIVQAWSEMYEAKRLKSGIPSHRLEPLLRRRVLKLYHALEHA